MNEQAIQDAYNLFVQQGYGKSIDDFKSLIATNPNALNDSYNLFTQQGYGKSIEDYKALMGLGAQPDLKKKGTTELPSEDTSLVSSKPLPKFLKQGQVAAETGFATPTGVTPLPETITNVIPEMAPPKKEKLLKIKRGGALSKDFSKEIMN